MTVVHATRYDTSVFVGNDRLVMGCLAFNPSAVLGELGDAVSTPVVDKDFAEAHHEYL